MSTPAPASEPAALPGGEPTDPVRGSALAHTAGAAVTEGAADPVRTRATAPSDPELPAAPDAFAADPARDPAGGPAPARDRTAAPTHAEPAATHSPFAADPARHPAVGPAPERSAAEPPATARAGRGHRRIGLPRRRRAVAAAAAAALVGSVLVTALHASAAPHGTDGAGRPGACVAQDPNKPPAPQDPGPTTVATVEQAYHCVLDHYYGGPALDDRPLLQSAFQAVVRELVRRGIDRPGAVLPALSGDHDADWPLFAARLQGVLDAVPDDAALRSALAVSAIQGLLAALHDDHAGYQTAAGTAPDPHPWGLGIGLNRTPTAPPSAPAFTGPLFVTAVTAGTPAAAAGLKPGDVIESVDGNPVLTAGQFNPGVLDLLHPAYPQRTPVALTVRRPDTGRTRHVRVVPGALPAQPAPRVTATLLPGGVADVRFDAFSPGIAAEVLKAIAGLRASGTVAGVVFDVRGNRGGVGAEGNTLLGAFVHGVTALSFCAADGTCEPQPVDDGTPLLHLPMAVLVDDGCASACEAFAAAVKDLHLGPLVGTRTAGANSGPAQLYPLDDGTSAIRLPSLRSLAPNGEITDGVGVPPDHFAPLTARDVATRQDPALAKAAALLGS